MRASLRPKALVALALAIAVLDACGTGHTPSPPAQLPTAPVDNLIAAQLAHIEQQLARIQASEYRLSGHRPAIRPCRPSPYARLLTMPAEGTAESAREDARAVLGTLVRALVRDIRPLATRLRRLNERSPYGDGAWPLISGRLLGSTVNHLVWITDALHESCTLTEIARLGSRDWQWAAHHYEGALLGAQVLSVWVSWLDFARELHVRTTISSEWILVQLAAPWNGEIKIVLNQLKDRTPHLIATAARIVQTRLPVWAEDLRDFGERAERLNRDTAALTRKLLMVQAVFDLAITHNLVGPLIGGGATGFAFTMPGIGGVTAGGAATGVRVAISAEWVKAIQHLVAIGAISTYEIARIAGVEPAAVSAPVAKPATPTAVARTDGSPASDPASSTRPVKVITRHRSGNRQVEVAGQRWHLPRGKKARDIPANDPVGDRLQAAVDRYKGEWSPAKLSKKERNAIGKARRAGEPWRARLLERQARGRWMERRMSDKFKELRWRGKGVDAVDPVTGLQYEVLSGTRSNLDLHGKRMAREMFRMITF